jgi:hypothetical protein
LVLALAVVLPGALAAKHHHGRHLRHRDHRIDKQEQSSSAWSGDGGGTVASFSNGLLTINLDAGGTVTGQVTPDTEITCQSASDESSDNSGDSGDNSGQSGDNSGDNTDRMARDGGSSGGDSSGDASADNNADNNDTGDESNNCSTSDLTPGTVVTQAELDSESNPPAFEQVDLAK